MSETLPQPEPVKPSRSFEGIQTELYAFKDAPDAQKERDLRIERARLINEAKEVGVLVNIKNHALDVQTKNPSILTSAPLINSINTIRLEEEARGLSGWKDEFEGLINTYKEGVLRNMTLAYLRKNNASASDISDLERDIELLNWGTPPALVDSMPIEPALADKAFGFGAKELAKEMAEAQGIMSPEKYLEDALDTEDQLKTAFMIVPGQEPRFWPILTEAEKDEWRVRANLIIAAYKKNNAEGTDKLYMGERKEMAVYIGKEAHQKIFKKPGVMATVGAYTTVIGDERFLSWKDTSDLYDEDGSPTDINYKKVFCENLQDRRVAMSVQNDYGDEIFNKLRVSEAELHKGCADSFYPHRDKKNGTPINEEAFRETRKSVRHWLLTKGRDLLLSENELADRDEFFNSKFKSKEELFKEMSLRAREAEQIAWNYVYINDLIETFDSREYRPEGTGRLFPSSYWQLFQWVPMHPQERFEAKIKRGADEPKEHWSALGDWGVYNITQKRFIDADGKFNMPENLKILPDSLIRSPLLPQRHEKGKGENKSLFSIYNSIGNDLIEGDISTVSNRELFNRIDWKDFPDSPFVPYVYDEMRWADVVTNVFKKGGERSSKVSGGDLAEAVYNLGLTRDQREKLLLIYLTGVDPKQTDLKSQLGGTVYSGARQGFLTVHPNYFYGVGR